MNERQATHHVRIGEDEEVVVVIDEKTGACAALLGLLAPWSCVASYLGRGEGWFKGGGLGLWGGAGVVGGGRGVCVRGSPPSMWPALVCCALRPLPHLAPT